jgi:uncharacterized protein (DUF58 family)
MDLAERKAGLTAGPRRELPITWQLSGHARRLATLAIAGLLFAVITRRAEFAGLAAPALLLLVGYRADKPSAIGAELATGAQPMTEGEQGAVLLRLSGLGASQAQVRLRPAPLITGGDAEQRVDGWYRLPFVPHRWGIRPVGTVEVRIWDRWRLAECRLDVSVPSVTCHPLPAVLDSLVVLSRLPARLGEHTSRRLGEGIEFAGVREFVPGDRQRRINWPATTRRGALQLNVFTAERAQNVVVLMDVSIDVGEPGRSSADLAVRAAAGTALRYLAARDRVGLISFGQQLQWVTPAAGRRQADRIMNLLMTKRTVGHPLDAMSALPHTAVPPGALVIAFSPLLSLRLVEALRQLRERGFAVLVVDVLLAQPGTGAGRYRLVADLALRIWRMEQEAIRFSLREIGIPVVAWDGQAPLDEPLAPYTRAPVVSQHWW